MKIFVQLALNTSDKQLLKSSASEYEVVFQDELTSTNEKKSALLEAEIVFGNAPVAWVNESAKARWLQLHSAGIDPYQELTFEASPALVVTNLHGFFGRPVAETALAGILARYRGIDVLARWQTTQHWAGKPLRSTLRTLLHAHVLILGAGTIGSTLATLLQGFGCKIDLMSRSSSNGTIRNTEQLEHVLPHVDIVVNTLPETSETIGLLTKHRLSLLKSTALFVNVGRGSVVDEAALVELLSTIPTFEAVLDVTDQEPLPAGHPFWILPNVLLTQHSAGGFADENRNKVLFFVDNLHRFEQGKPLESVVNFRRGY
ncbi:MAG: D-2-hydroxyacid dehydrogenase [Spirosomataceae bacterium]